MAVSQGLLAEARTVSVVDQINNLSCGEPELQVLIRWLDNSFNPSDVASLPLDVLLGK